MHYPIIIETDEDGVIIASCPIFKGCHSYGKTVDEAMENIKEVLEMCIQEEKEKSSYKNKFLGFREIEIGQLAA